MQVYTKPVFLAFVRFICDPIGHSFGIPPYYVLLGGGIVWLCTVKEDKMEEQLPVASIEDFLTCF